MIRSRATVFRETLFRSPRFRMNAFCASVNFDAFMRLCSSPSQGRLAENSSFKRSRIQGAELMQPF